MCKVLVRRAEREKTMKKVIQDEKKERKECNEIKMTMTENK